VPFLSGRRVLWQALIVIERADDRTVSIGERQQRILESSQAFRAYGEGGNP